MTPLFVALGYREEKEGGLHSQYLNLTQTTTSLLTGMSIAFLKTQRGFLHHLPKQITENTERDKNFGKLLSEFRGPRRKDTTVT